MASLFIGHAAQKSKLHNLQYDEGGNHMAEAEAEVYHWISFLVCDRLTPNKHNFTSRKDIIVNNLTSSRFSI